MIFLGQVRFRRGTAAAWTAANPILAAGELGFETDTGLSKLGDGTTAWTSLPYTTAITSIADDAVTNAKLANMASGRIKGRVTSGTGDPEDLTAAQATSLLNTFTNTEKGLAPASGGGTANFLRADGTWAVPVVGGLNDGDKGDITVSNNGATWTVDAGAITDAKLRNSAGVSVIGRSTNSTGAPADIVAGSDGHVLRRESGALGFGTIPQSSSHDSADTDSSATALHHTLGTGANQAAPGNHSHTQLHDRSHAITSTNDHTAGNWKVIYTNGSGQVTELALGTSGLALVSQGTSAAPIFGLPNSLNDGDKGDVTAFDGTITINLNAVTNAKLRDSAALSVIGRATNSTGDPADISAANDGEVLRRSGTSLGFGVIGTASLGGDITAAGKALLDDASAADQRATLGLGTAATLKIHVGTSAPNNPAVNDIWIDTN
jgi:hypothetical protein